jgi:DNA-binding FadR family transcriptional regulator
MFSPADIPASRHSGAVEGLAELIVENLAQGRSLVPPEPELCNALGVSRSVVREAVRTLSAKGVIAVRRGSGTTVQPLDEWDLFDPQVLRWRFAAGITPRLVDHLIDFRLSIEPFAARKAAGTQSFPIHDLEVCYVRMMHAANGLGDFVNADLRFHETILRGPDNPFINRIIPLINGALLLSFQHSVADPQIARQALPLHKRVVDWIAKGNPDEAERAMRGVIISAREDLIESMSIR